MRKEDCRVGMLVEISDHPKAKEEYVGKRGVIKEVDPTPWFDLSIDMGDRVVSGSALTVKVVEEDLEVGDSVLYNGQYYGKVFGLAAKKDISDREVAITYENGGEVVNSVVDRVKVKKLKDPESLVKGDRFISDYGRGLTVENRHRDPNGELYYFVIDDEGYCDLESVDTVAEVVS